MPEDPCAGPPLLQASGASCYCAAEAALGCSPSVPLCFLKSAEVGLPNLPKCTGMRATRQELDASCGASKLTCRVFFFSLSPSLCAGEERTCGRDAEREEKPYSLPRRRREGRIEEWLLGSRNPNARARRLLFPLRFAANTFVHSGAFLFFCRCGGALARPLLQHPDACPSVTCRAAKCVRCFC